MSKLPNDLKAELLAVIIEVTYEYMSSTMDEIVMSGGSFKGVDNMSDDDIINEYDTYSDLGTNDLRSRLTAWRVTQPVTTLVMWGRSQDIVARWAIDSITSLMNRLTEAQVNDHEDHEGLLRMMEMENYEVNKRVYEAVKRWILGMEV